MSEYGVLAEYLRIKIPTLAYSTLERGIDFFHFRYIISHGLPYGPRPFYFSKTAISNSETPLQSSMKSEHSNVSSN